MSFIKRFTDFLNANAPSAASSQPHVQPNQATSSGSNQPNTGTASATTGSHHIDRKKVVFKQISPNDVIAEEEKQWRRNGGAIEGDTVTTRAITASGQLADPTKLQSVCHICNRLEDVIIRSEVSHVTLCRTCQRIFEQPDGKKMVVTPDEYKALLYQFDTWARHDSKRNGEQK